MNEDRALPRQTSSQPSRLKTSDPPNPDEIRRRCAGLRSGLIQDGLYQPQKAQPDLEPAAADAETTALTWRISPEPFWITAEDLRALQELGSHLLSFYAALNRLYFASVHGSQPGWISRYLDQGKPEAQIEYGRMNRFKRETSPDGTARSPAAPDDPAAVNVLGLRRRDAHAVHV